MLTGATVEAAFAGAPAFADKLWPQLVQNADDGLTGALQDGHVLAGETGANAGAAFTSGCPQPVQNLEASSASLPHDVQTAISAPSSDDNAFVPQAKLFHSSEKCVSQCRQF
ncbi:MAG TPA: hypothetical protein VJW20_16275 [Candidatus Angelobacter sp.]|nr:hypothetical protein [Candidatus Angelobacter sp.]